MTDMRQKAFYLSICLAITDKLIEGTKYGTVEHDRLQSLNDKVLRITDMYRPTAWGPDEMRIAGEVFDRLNEDIAKSFQ